MNISYTANLVFYCSGHWQRVLLLFVSFKFIFPVPIFVDAALSDVFLLGVILGEACKFQSQPLVLKGATIIDQGALGLCLLMYHPDLADLLWMRTSYVWVNNSLSNPKLGE